MHCSDCELVGRCCVEQGPVPGMTPSGVLSTASSRLEFPGRFPHSLFIRIHRVWS